MPLNSTKRQALFNLLCRQTSPRFTEYLRVYEHLPQPRGESFELSCELVDGVRVDSMRVAIMCLRKKEVLRWLLASNNRVPFVRDVLFDNETDECFGIGMADYPTGLGARRIKIYNAYKRSQVRVRKTDHILQLCDLFNIPDNGFRKDLERFEKIELSSIDWSREKKAAIKVYFGPFNSDQLFKRFSRVFPKDEIMPYRVLCEKKLLPEVVYFTAKYSQEGHTFRVDLCNRMKDIRPYLKAFDHHQQVSGFLADFRRIFPDLHLQWISTQGAFFHKIQLYFFLGSKNKPKRPFSDQCR